MIINKGLHKKDIEIAVGDIVYLHQHPKTWNVTHIDGDMVALMNNDEDQMRTYKREAFMKDFYFKVNEQQES